MILYWNQAEQELVFGWFMFFEIRQNSIKNFPEVHCGTTVKVKGEGRTLMDHNWAKKNLKLHSHLQFLLVKHSRRHFKTYVAAVNDTLPRI